MASVISADQMIVHEERSTPSTERAKAELDKIRLARDQACGPALGKSKACQLREQEVIRAEGKPVDAQAKVAAAARPESTDFARLVKWVSRGWIAPSQRDFDMLWLLFRTLLPQIGGLLLMLARQ
jgi:hypothetical protein